MNSERVEQSSGGDAPSPVGAVPRIGRCPCCLQTRRLDDAAYCDRCVVNYGHLCWGVARMRADRKFAQQCFESLSLCHRPRFIEMFGNPYEG